MAVAAPIGLFTEHAARACHTRGPNVRAKFCRRDVSHEFKLIWIHARSRCVKLHKNIHVTRGDMYIFMTENPIGDRVSLPSGVTGLLVFRFFKCLLYFTCLAYFSKNLNGDWLVLGINTFCADSVFGHLLFISKALAKRTRKSTQVLVSFRLATHLRRLWSSSNWTQVDASFFYRLATQRKWTQVDRTTCRYKTH